MPFTTLAFPVFFAVVFLAYYILPRKTQWLLLLCASIFFYGFASPFYLLLLVGVGTITYVGALCVQGIQQKRDACLAQNKRLFSREQKRSCREQAQRRSLRMVAVVVVTLLLLLGVFKYLQFLLNNVAWIGGALGWNITSPTLNIILPVGLSFYIFQSMGYVIDVHRELALPERNFFKHMLFVSYFPQIMQGPIGSYSRLAPQLFAEHKFDYEQTVFGLYRIAWGLFKKFMVANVIASRINCVWGDVQAYPGAFCWTVILTCYAMQIYADFSGYMDIACGCSQMLGIRIDENFNCPYFSKSVAEYWRRWHMTLGAWFRDYLFYPILRSEKSVSLTRKLSKYSKYLASVIPTSWALAIVWFATGLWHGATWGYIAWGVYYGVFIISGVFLEPIYNKFHNKFKNLCTCKGYALFQMVRTFAIVVLGYSIFKPARLSSTLEIWKRMLYGNESEGVYKILHTLHLDFRWTCVWILIMMCVDVWHFNHNNGSLREHVRGLHWTFRWALYLVGIALVMFYGVYAVSQLNSFEYFKF